MMLSDDPNLSLRNAATEVGIRHTTIRRVLIEDLKLFPYKIEYVNEVMMRTKLGELILFNTIIMS